MAKKTKRGWYCSDCMIFPEFVCIEILEKVNVEYTYLGNDGDLKKVVNSRPFFGGETIKVGKPICQICGNKVTWKK